jgi:NAD(P)-dependent dehydrogenase (short-subunit alcohol dehydrogenase family)
VRGEAAALAFAREGARVAVTGRNRPALDDVGATRGMHTILGQILHFPDTFAFGLEALVSGFPEPPSPQGYFIASTGP